MSIYKENDIIECSVTGIEKYGFFVKTKDGYNGLIHISEISSSFIKSIYDYVSMGETIRAKILSVDEDNKQIKLSIKDIDYRIHTSLPADRVEGFKILKEHLPIWMEDALKEINDNNT